ncbi:MAG: ferrous iron transport protein B [Fusobacteriota bacterium]
MLKIAFAGNPNVGKTALINKIAGTKLKVGNWPGVTIEKKEAIFEYNKEKIKIIDLPGVYSLSPYSMEEIITRDFILEEDPDVIINVVDSTNLSRNLYLTLLLKELGKPMVLALNFSDEFEKLDYELDKDLLEDLLDIKAVETNGLKGKGIEELLDNSIDISKKSNSKGHIDYNLSFDKTLEDEIKNVISKIENDKEIGNIFFKYPKDFVAIKLLEEDEHFFEKISEKVNLDEIKKITEESKKNIKQRFNEKPENAFTEARYGAINGILARSLKQSKKSRLEFTQKVDKVLLNRFFGPVIFIGIMFALLSLTFNGSAPYIDWVDGFIADYFGKYIGVAIEGVPQWLDAFIMDGIIGGLGGVLVFVPLMLFLYFFMAILEESGYMARVAFLMDKIMRSVGLSGKAFLPMMLGFGCTVPAIYATRTLEDENSRKLTAIMTPMMSCGARLPVYALFTAAFFGKNAGLIVLSIYLVGIIIAAMVGLIMKRYAYFKPKEKELLIELPPYRMPAIGMVFNSMFEKTWGYIKKAGTVILGVLIILWVLMYFPNQGDVEKSFVGYAGRAVQPIFEPTGFGDRWEIVASIPPSLVAKEVVVGFLGQVLGTVEEEEEISESKFKEDTVNQIINFKDATVDSVKAMFSFDVAGLFAPPSAEEVEEEGGKGIIQNMKNLWGDEKEGPIKAYSFMLFILLVIPCVVTLGALKQEFGYKMVGITLIVYSVVPYVISVLFYQTARLFI